MSTKPSLDELFDQRQTYPDIDSRMRLERLVGLDEQKSRLSKILGLLVHPAGLEAWADKHHPGAAALVDTVLRRLPWSSSRAMSDRARPSWPKRSAMPSRAKKGSTSPSSRSASPRAAKVRSAR